MRRTNHETTPTRRFDPTVGAITAKEAVDDALTEDADLTDYLMRAWYELIHLSPTPVPRCPHCDGLRIRPDRPSGKSKLPIYFCHACKKSFNRLTGTPFANLKNLAKGTEMIPLLSRQMSLLQAGERLGRTQKAVLSWLLAFRRYLLELDPSGRWEARVRLGVRVAPRVRCTRCGFDGGFLAGGFDPQRRRRIRCPKCGRSRLLDVLQDQGEGIKGEVVHDAIDTAIRARRKVHPEMPVSVVVRAASVSDAALEVKVPDRVLWSELELPDRRLPPGPVERVEDTVLSKFLLEQIETALSHSTIHPQCPWCSGEHTQREPIVRTCEKCGHTGLIRLLGPTNRPLAANGERQYRFRCGSCSRCSRTWLSSADRGVALRGRYRSSSRTARDRFLTG